MRVCGIDPGSNGAICVLDSQDPTYIALLDLKKATVWDIYHELFTHLPDLIWIEDVHSLFGMSAKSNFTFGRNLGSIHAIAEINCFGRPPNTVAPKVWQKFAGVTAKGKWIKKEVAQIATKLYPAANLRGKRGGLLDGRSDALMIAHYGLNYKEKV